MQEAVLSLNNTLTREGFEPISPKIFSGLSPSLVNAISARLYEILSAHSFLKSKCEEFKLERSAVMRELSSLNQSVDELSAATRRLELELAEQDVWNVSFRSFSIVHGCFS